MSFVRKPILLSILLSLLCGVVPRVTSAAPTEAGAGTVTTPSKRVVNINKASVKELMKLPLVGAVTAKRIVEHRKAIGPFKKVDELRNVKGIGERTFLRIRDLVTTGKAVVTGALKTEGENAR